MILFFTLASLICSVTVIAADETSGDIRIEFTKIENTMPYITLTIIGCLILAGIVVSIAILAGNRPKSRGMRGRRSPPSAIRVKQETTPSRSAYYEAAIKKPVVEKMEVEKQHDAPFLQQQTKIDRHLKEDEQVIINILRMKQGSCTQATIRVISDFSKARLSRILSELEARGFIYKQAKGRKNIITLRDAA